MINLFESFSHETRLLFQSLKQAGYTHPTVVMDDDGFLPEDVVSPYQFFSGFKPLKSDKGLFFNQVETPMYWEIDGNNNDAVIKDMGWTRGKIHYRKLYKNRIVSRVDWLDANGRLRSVDHYNQYGFKFANTVYDIRGVAILKTYFDRKGKVVVYENYVTQDYVVTYKGKDHFFNNKSAYILFYLKEAFEDLSGFVINSLSTPFFVVYQLGVKGKDYLFWQEPVGDDIPGNMKIMFESPTRDFTVAVPNQQVYDRMQQIVQHDLRRRILPTGYLYRYMKKASYNEHILTLTNSDQLEGIESDVQSLPNHTFHIAAVTEMSPKLMALGKYSNVKLYPNVKREMLLNLYKQSSIYLDINHGGELLDAVRAAFDYNMVILGIDELAKNRDFTLPAHLFGKHDTGLIQTIQSFDQRPKSYNEALKLQKAHANEINAAQFHKVFK